MNNMFNDAKPFLFESARRLRRSMTNAEIMLWKYLRTSQKGYKFRRQHPFGLFVLDFYSHQLKLAIEVDGSVHEVETVQQNDCDRQKEIEANNISVIRFSNHDVLNNITQVITDLEKEIEKIIKTKITLPFRGWG